MKILVAGWDSGGGVEAVQTVVRRAAARGHQVRVLGTEGLRSRFESAGADLPRLPVRPGQRLPVGRDGPGAGVGGAHPAGAVRPGPGPGDVRARPRVLPRHHRGAGPGAGRPGGRGHPDPVRAVRGRSGRVSLGPADARAVPDAAAGRAAAGDGVHARARAPGPLARPGRRGADDAGVPDRDARPQPGPGRARPAPVRDLADVLNAASRVLVCTSPSYDFAADAVPGHVRYVGPQLDDDPDPTPPARRGTIRAAARSSWSA